MSFGLDSISARLQETAPELAAGDASDRWLLSLGALLAVLVVGSIGRLVLSRHLARLAARTETPLDDIFVAVARPLWSPGVVLLALAVATRASPLPESPRALLVRLLLSGFLAVLVLGASRLTERWIGTRASAGSAARPSLLQASARVAVLIAGALLVLDNAGLEITPLLAALGVGSLAVGLALQPTLSNFFAGVHLSMARPIRVGDFIELEDGVQGHVEDIGWRATRLRQLPNNLLVVPNARLAEMRLINYSLPDEPQALVVTLGVGYGSDLEKVEAVTVEVARELQRSLPEADPEHEPFLRFTGFGDSAIDFNVILRARAYTDRWPLVHALIKNLHARYRAEGIEIPFPQRVVTMRKEES